MNTCTICGGIISKKLIKYAQEIDGKLVVVENVLAEVCDQCGEELFSPETTEKLQKIIQNYRNEPFRQELVLFLDLALSKAS